MNENLEQKQESSKTWSWGKLKDATDDWKEDIVSGPFGSNLVVADYRQTGVPLIRLQNVQRSFFLDSDIKFVSKEKAEELSRHSFKVGDLIMAKLGVPIGKTCTVPNTFQSGIIVADVVRIRISKSNNSKFFEFLLNSPLITNQLTSKIIGSTRPRVNLDHVRELIVPIPEVKEQNQIADKLTRTQNYCNLIKDDIAQELAAVTGLYEAILNDTFGNHFQNSDANDE